MTDVECREKPVYTADEPVQATPTKEPTPSRSPKHWSDKSIPAFSETRAFNRPQEPDRMPSQDQLEKRFLYRMHKIEETIHSPEFQDHLRNCPKRVDGQPNYTNPAKDQPFTLRSIMAIRQIVESIVNSEETSFARWSNSPSEFQIVNSYMNIMEFYLCHFRTGCMYFSNKYVDKGFEVIDKMMSHLIKDVELSLEQKEKTS